MPDLKKPISYKPITHVTVRYVVGALPQGESVPGLPLDGSTISAPAVQAEAWIAAGIAKRAAVAAESKETK